MSEIKKRNPTEAEALDSREVAEMVEKQHKDLLRDIRGYIAEMEELGERNFAPSSNVPKINPSDFFIPSTYNSDQGKELPNFLITKKGCEFVANKLTGEKGTKFTALYVTRFNIMEEREKQSLNSGQQTKASPDPTKQILAEAKLNNSRARLSSMWLKIAGIVSIPEYKDICASHASTALAGKEVLPLPDCTEHLYTATEVGALLGGIDKAKIGHIAKVNGLKTPEYGKTVWDKSPYSNKQVETFRYNDKAVERFREILNRASD